MSTTAIILAAGKGTRMKSDLPKVLHPVCGRPMLAWVVDACRQAGVDQFIMVVGHKAEMVQSEMSNMPAGTKWVVQSPQLGTGHAVMVCQDELARLQGPVLVVAGDGPLIHAQTLRQLLDTHRNEQAACTLATSILAEPGSYGRIVRDDAGELCAIVEALDTTPDQKKIKEVNVSLYCYDAAALRSVLPKLTNANSKGEYYLTDTLVLLRQAGAKLSAVAAVPSEDVLSINTLQELADVEAILSRRLGGVGAKP